MTKETLISNIENDENVLEIIENEKIADISANVEEWMVRSLVKSNETTATIESKQYYVYKDNAYNKE